MTAVVEGALLRILAESSSPGTDAPVVNSRRARKHCGTLISVEFDPEIHDMSRRESNDYFRSGYQVQVVDWIMSKGDTIYESAPTSYRHEFEKCVSDGRPTTFRTSIYECGDDEAPKHLTPGKTHQIAEVKADFADIPEQSFQQVPGRNGQWFYKIPFEIEMTCYSAKRRFVLVYNGRRYDTVEVHYRHADI